MRVAKIEITDFKGIAKLEARPGALTVVSGANGEGKTSVIDAIRAAFEGGHDAALIRSGAKKAEVSLTLEDGTIIKRSVTPKASTVDVTTKDGDKKAAAATYVKSLASGIALDPIAFLAMPPKKRAEYLLETSSVRFTHEELKAIDVVSDDVNIEGLDKVRKDIYEWRRVANVRTDEAEKQVKALKSALPEDMDTDFIAEAKKVADEHAEAKARLANLEATANAEWETYKSETEERYRVMIDELKKQIAAKEQERDETLKQSREEWSQEKNKATMEALREVEGLSAKRRELEAKADEQRRGLTLKGELESARKRMEQHNSEAQKHDRALKALDELKAKKLAEDGIEGVEVVDGDIHVDGIPFDKLNTQRQYEMAFQLASRGLGQLPIMICDRAESFDDENWQQFCEVAKESGIQVIAARVTSGPLKVEVAA